MVQNSSSFQDDYYAQAKQKPVTPSVDTNEKSAIKLKIKAKKIESTESEPGTLLTPEAPQNEQIQEESPRGARLIKREHPSTGLMNSVMRS